jgi:ankyrin repeat protein
MRFVFLLSLLLANSFLNAQYNCDSLVQAAAKLNLEKIKACLKSGVRPDCSSSKGIYPVAAVLNEIRCKYRDNTIAFQILDELIAAGADLNNPKLTPKGTAIEYSVSGFADLCLFHYLEGKGLKADSRVYSRLILSANHGQILYMLRRGIPLPEKGWLADYILISNTASDDGSAIPHLRDTLFSMKKDLEEFSADGLLPVHAAIKIGDTVWLRYLLDAGVDINRPDEMNGWSPLHYASYYHEANRSYYPGKMKALKWLLEKNALLDQKTSWEYQESWTHSFNPKIPEGATPLDIAIICKAPQVVIDMLKKKGAINNVAK